MNNKSYLLYTLILITAGLWSCTPNKTTFSQGLLKGVTVDTYDFNSSRLDPKTRWITVLDNSVSMTEERNKIAISMEKTVQKFVGYNVELFLYNTNPVKEKFTINTRGNRFIEGFATNDQDLSIWQPLREDIYDSGFMTLDNIKYIDRDGVEQFQIPRTGNEFLYQMPWQVSFDAKSVSYTHLTLPTIYSV